MKTYIKDMHADIIVVNDYADIDINQVGITFFGGDMGDEESTEAIMFLTYEQTGELLQALELARANIAPEF